jgi:hypothetical protein
MRSRDVVPVALLVGIAAFVIGRETRVRSERAARAKEAVATTPAPQGAPATSAAPESVSSTDTLSVRDTTQTSGLVSVRRSGNDAPPRDLAALQERIREGSPGTYFLAMLQEQGDLIMRWPDRRVEPVRVFVERYTTLPDFDPNYPTVAERVFEEWNAAGFPLRFDFVTESSQADIKINWAAQLEPGDEPRRIGVTTKTRDQYGWIVAAEITISTHDRDTGKPHPAELVAAIARHEVGHALGLGHSPNRGDVMFPESTSLSISAADRATLHLLYILPPGPAK